MLQTTYIKKNNVGIKFETHYKYQNGKAIGEVYSATTVTLYGFTWKEEEREFSTKEEGNAYFRECLNNGFERCTYSEHEALRPWD